MIFQTASTIWMGVLFFGATATGTWLPAIAMSQDSDGFERPNVILIVTDDQGIGDFGVMGNSVFETPAIDAFTKQCASMNTFYVSPVCSPTRASLMTGRYNQRTRCIDTWVGRSMMEPEEVTVAELLSQSGYATGIFGKWHLGDCYPMRPQDQGFDEVLVHRGGGLAQPSEPRENRRRYTNPILFHNGTQIQTEGFCTDVYFDAAMGFIEKSQAEDRNFFVYLATNAPHGPFHDVPEVLRIHYSNQDLSSIMVDPPSSPDALASQQDKLARIGAMVTNIDQNMKRLLARLDQLGIADDTLIVFMVDNGPNSRRYVGERRGMKSEVFEGGIRSPFWLRWPARVESGRSSNRVAAHIDVMPTILDACHVDLPADVKIDGRSILPLLTQVNPTWPDRNLVIQTHRGDIPKRYHHFMIRDDRYKLLHASGFGKEAFVGKPQFKLYDIILDPGESNDLLKENPEVVARLTKAYDVWFDDVSTTRENNFAPPRIHIGSPHENPTVLTRQDWRGGKWSRHSVGFWELHVAQTGSYEIEVLFDAAKTKEHLTVEFVDVSVVDAKQQAGRFSGIVEAGADRLTLEIELVEGDFQLHAVLVSDDGIEEGRRGIYQAIVKRVTRGE